MILTQKLKDDIKNHALSKIPEECCGVVVLFKGREKYIPCENAHPTPDREFYISPNDLSQAYDIGEVIAVVHSHPDEQATRSFSDADKIAQAQTELPWIMYNVYFDEFHELSDSEKPSLYGREYKHGITDCYSFVRDFYQQELGIALTNFAREDEWWNKGQNLYLDNYEKEGFIKVDFSDTRYGDLLVLTIGSSVPNHGGVYVGGNKIAHHAYNRLSCVDVYGSFLRDRTALVLRHKEMVNRNVENYQA